MTEVKTSCGFEASVDEEAVNDMAFLEALTDFQDGDATALPKLARLFLKPEDRKRLYELLKDENGRTPIDKAVNQITEILGQLNSKKK